MGYLNVVLLELVLCLERVFVSAASVQERGLEWRSLAKAYYLDRGATKETTRLGRINHVGIDPVKANSSCYNYDLLACFL